MSHAVFRVAVRMSQVTMGKGKPTYCYDDRELKAALAGSAPGSYTLQRFKVQAMASVSSLERELTAFHH